MTVGELFARWGVFLFVLWVLFRLFEYGVIAVALCFEAWRRRRLRPRS